MEFLHLATHENLDLVQSTILVLGLLIAAHTAWLDARARRVGNWLAITKGHRELWSLALGQPALLRIAQADVDLSHAPVTEAEETFVMLLISHLASAYQAVRLNMVIAPTGIEGDVHAFLCLPIPRAVWDRVKSVQDHDFVAFVERCLKTAPSHVPR